MIVLRRNSALPLLWIVGILSSSLLFPPTTIGSIASADSATRTNELSVQDGDAELFTPLPTASSADSSPRPDGFWLVSSRQCKTNSHSLCPSCDLQYQHFPSDACPHQATAEDFRTSLVPDIPVCVVVHGSFVHSRHVASESAILYEWLRSAAPDRPLQVVFFTWPSNGPLSVSSALGWISVFPSVDVTVLGRRSSRHGLHLAELLSNVPESCPISLLGHSHGARVVVSALHLLGGGEVQGLTSPYACCVSNRIRVVLAAAAIDHHWLNPNERYEHALCRAECLLNLRSARDGALRCYPLGVPFSRRALGLAGFTSRDHRRQGCLCERTAELNVTGLIKSGHVLGHYTRRPEIAYAISPYIYFDD